MPSSIFISHAGTETEIALRVADALRDAGLSVRIDRDALGVGGSFIGFMNSALAECDYCLLLWSRAASQTKWVEVEWQAALCRAINETGQFLVIGRLDDHPIPPILAPRLHVMLVPDMKAGLDRLLAMWRADAKAEAISERPVAIGRHPVAEDAHGEVVYVTSELFGRTMPLRVTFDVPCGVQLDRLVDDLGFPRRVAHQGVIGVALRYEFAHDSRVLAPTESFAQQGIHAGDVLWLRVTVMPFADVQPVSGGLAPAVFRGGSDPGAGRWRRLAEERLRTAIAEAGLGN